MQVEIGKWGDTLALRIPSDFAREAQLEEGTAVELTLEEGQLVISPVRPKYSLDELVAGITPDNRHAETDWGSPVGNELW